MVTKTTTVINPSGIHARPASTFIQAASQFESHITIRKVGSENTANAKSIISVLVQSLGIGTQVEIAADGPDEQAAVDTLVALIDSGLGETAENQT